MPAPDAPGGDEELDRLFALPLRDFVAARDALAKRLKADGDPGAAARVRRLARPSATAWAVNRLFRERRERWDALIAAGAALREAYAGRGVPVAEAARDRQAALAAALRETLDLLVGGGHASSAQAERRIRGTLDALAAGADVAPGRLASDLEPPSFDVLAGVEPVVAARLAPALGEREAAGGGEPAAAADAAAEQEALALARRRSEAARRALEQAEEARRAARVRADAADSEIDEAERRVDRARHRAAEARRAADQADAAAAEARAALERALQERAELERGR